MINKKIQLRENNSNIYMETYIINDPLEKSRKRPLVVVCPGGGYEYCSAREAEPIALGFNAAGFHAVVVYYSINERYPEALKDVSEAVVRVRENADEWCVDTDKIVVCGFSAGGHLAGSLGVFWNSESAIKREDKLNKPNGMILSYPVITSGEKRHEGSINVLAGDNAEMREWVSLEKHVSEDCPPAFIWHTFTDACVPVENSVYMMDALTAKGIPTELHIYPKGPHGLSLSNEFVSESDEGIVNEVQDWIRYAVRWIKENI